ncbi:DUF998 domain-containing protein [Agromyces sp. ISL-38]|uniref:DUF998 domain-containing protein n=1 Tax=Agromyces sp. ISL-38 TaxID=2819107 RepID=UPI001BE99226|nr:DUF998 domain-containing protein [Agromyces sp. ISL-38]MBT2500827.1 DUF998 domain-containing protein [Agromyces sp. ISL-38]MBT2519134.1 DUF998 domain-containing protein [Streptomyces sp. ISL-90]
MFTLTYVAQELARIDEYSPIEETVSALAAGPNGWIQSANFVVLGLLTIAFAAGLYGVLQPSKPGMVGAALMFVSGIANILVGTAFPLREDAAGATYDPGGHQAVGFVFFTSSALALLVISFALSKQTEWRKLAIPVRLAGILMLVSNPIMGILVIPDDAPLHDWAGLAQRGIVLGLLFPARLALSYRMLRLPEQTRSASAIKRPAQPSAGTDAPRV